MSDNERPPAMIFWLDDFVNSGGLEYISDELCIFP